MAAEKFENVKIRHIDAKNNIRKLAIDILISVPMTEILLDVVVVVVVWRGFGGRDLIPTHRKIS
jgi:hypothetical protein